jgi:hypothetical protein
VFITTLSLSISCICCSTVLCFVRYSDRSPFISCRRPSLCACGDDDDNDDGDGGDDDGDSDDDDIDDDNDNVDNDDDDVDNGDDGDDDVYLKKIITRGVTKSNTQKCRRHRRVNIQIIKDTDITEQPNNNLCMLLCPPYPPDGGGHGGLT